MVEKIGLDHPIELLMDGPGGDVLVVPLPEIGRRARNIAALAERIAVSRPGPLINVDGSGHIEIRSESLVNPEEQGLGVKKTG